MQLKILGKLQETLIKKAQKARLEESFAQFSGSNVGAAILTIEEEIRIKAAIKDLYLLEYRSNNKFKL